MAAFLARLGGFCARRRWWVLCAWILVLVLAGVGAARFAQPLTSKFSVAGMQSTKTLDLVDREFGTSDGGGKVVFAAPSGSKLTATDAVTVATLSRELAEVSGVRSATDPFTAQVKTLSPEGRIGYVPVTLTSEDASDATKDGIATAMSHAREAGLQVEASSELAPEPASSSSQGIGIVIALVILLVTFGSLVASGLPLLVAIVGLAISLTVIHAATAFVAVNSVAPTLAILLGLAVGIDYSLFLVNRHRQQLLAGAEVRASIARAMGTAGSAVFFAALTVIIALAGLAVVRIGFLTQMGLGAAFAVLVALLVALTLTPALLGFAGTRVLGRRARRRLASGAEHEGSGMGPESGRRPNQGGARRWAELVMAHRVVAVVASVVLLGLLAVPVLGMRLGLPNDGTDPSSTTDRKAYDLLADGFGAGMNGPLLVLAPASDVAEVTQRITATDDVARVLVSGVKDGRALLTVIPKSGPSDQATATLVGSLREMPGSSVLVTGETAVDIDISNRLLDALPLYLALVAGFAFVLLLVIFGSILIPLKATLSFLLSLGAALGCTVAVYQWGWLGNVFGVDPAAPLLSFLPTIIIGVLFGLSMDYEMFLVSGMREEHVHGAEDGEAVVTGFASGAKVVVAAALIMVGVFGGGVVTGSSLTKPIAFALALGVLVDAFVVRLLLVPAVLSLFGRAAWWLPNWLGRIAPTGASRSNGFMTRAGNFTGTTRSSHQSARNASSVGAGPEGDLGQEERADHADQGDDGRDQEDAAGGVAVGGPDDFPSGRR